MFPSRMRKSGGEQCGRRIWRWLSCTMGNTVKGNMASPWRWTPLETWWVWCDTNSLDLLFSFYKIISPLRLFVCLSRKTNEEFRQLVNGYKHQRNRKGKVFQEPLMLQIPKSVDWREKGCVTPVKNQVWGLGDVSAVWAGEPEFESHSPHLGGRKLMVALMPVSRKQDR